MKTFFRILRPFLTVVCCFGPVFSALPQQWRLLPLPPLPFEVARLKYWASDYLTVTRSFYVSKKGEAYDGTMPVKLTTEYGLRENEPLWFEILSDKSDKNQDLLPGVVITDIDGCTTRGMSEREFYQLLVKSDEHELGCMHMGYRPFKLCIRVNNTPHWVKLSKEMNRLDTEKYQEVEIAGMFQQWMLYHCVSGESEAKSFEAHVAKMREKGLGEISRFWDQDFDWFGATTYDFVLAGNDPLVDKEIMSVFAAQFGPFLTRDTEDPDVLIMISKDKNESVQSTYVPPTTTVINDGRTTRRVYNWTRTDYRYETQEHAHVERDGGYTQTTVLTDLFLEISMLDAKRLRDSTLRVPPIVYQLKFNRHVTDRQFRILDEYKAAASWVSHPFSPVRQSYEFSMANYKYEPVGTSKKAQRITFVKKGLSADAAGYREGDLIELGRKGGPRVVERNGKKANIPLPYVEENSTVRLYWHFFGDVTTAVEWWKK